MESKNDFNQVEQIEQLKQKPTYTTLQQILILTNESDAVIKFAAIEALIFYTDFPEAEDKLLGLINDPDWEVRNTALESLRYFTNISVLRAAQKKLKDPDSLVRVTAVEVVGSFDLMESASYLIEALHDKNEYVRGTAAEVLGKLQFDDVVIVLEEGLKKERRNWARLGYYVGLVLSGQDQYLDLIIAMLGNRSYKIRCAVANSLVELVNENSQSKILEALSKALRREETVAGRSSIESAIDYINSQ